MSINWGVVAVVVGGVTLVSVLGFSIVHARQLRIMRDHFNRRMDGLTRGIDAVREVANTLLSPAAAVHGGRDSRVGPRRPPTPSSAERQD
jgi:hypothetical protein